MFFNALGITHGVSLGSEGMKSHGLDGDGELSAPPSKIVHVTAAQTSETQEKIIECEL